MPVIHDVLSLDLISEKDNVNQGAELKARDYGSRADNSFKYKWLAWSQDRSYRYLSYVVSLET